MSPGSAMIVPGEQEQIEGGLQAEGVPLVSGSGRPVAQAREALRLHGCRLAVCGAALAVLLVPAALLGILGHQPVSAKDAGSGSFLQPEELLIKEEAPDKYAGQPEMGNQTTFRLVTDGTSFSFHASFYLDETWEERAVFEANPSLGFRIAVDGRVTIVMQLLNSKEVVLASSVEDITSFMLHSVQVDKTPEKLCVKIDKGAGSCKSAQDIGLDTVLFQMRPPRGPFTLAEHFVGHSIFQQDMGVVTFSMMVQGLPPLPNITQTGELKKLLFGVRKLFRFTSGIVGPPAKMKDLQASVLPAAATRRVLQAGGKSSSQKNPLILFVGITMYGAGLAKLEDLLNASLDETAKRVAGLLTTQKYDVQVTDVSIPAAQFDAEQVECPPGRNASTNLTCVGPQCEEILCDPATTCAAYTCPENTFKVPDVAAARCVGSDCDSTCCYAYCDQLTCGDPYGCVPEMNWNKTCAVGPECEKKCCVKRDLPKPCCQEYSVDCLSCKLCMPPKEFCALQDSNASTDMNASEAEDAVAPLTNVTEEIEAADASSAAEAVDEAAAARRLKDRNMQFYMDQEVQSAEDKEEMEKQETIDERREKRAQRRVDKMLELRDVAREYGIYGPENESQSAFYGGSKGYYELARAAANVAVGCVTDTAAKVCGLRKTAAFHRPPYFLGPSGDLLPILDPNVTAVAPLKDGVRGIVAFTDGNLYTFYLRTGVKDQWLGLHALGITALSVQDDGVNVVIGSQLGYLKVINVNDPRFALKISEPVLGVGDSLILSLGAVPAYDMALVGSANNFTTFWNYQTGNALRVPRNVASNETQENRRSRAATLAADVWYPGPRSGPNSATKTFLDPIVQKHLPAFQQSLQDVRDTFALYPNRTPLPTENTFGAVNSIAYVPIRARFVTGHSDARVRYWSAQNGKLLVQFAGHTGPVWAVAASPTSEVMFSGGEDGTVRAWSATTGMEIMKFETNGGPVKSLSVAAGGETLYAGGIDGILRLYDVSFAPGRPLCEQPIFHGSIMSVAASIGIATQVTVATQRGWVGIYQA